MARMRCAPMINSAPRRPSSESMSKKPLDQSAITLEGLLDAAQARGFLINKLGQFEAFEALLAALENAKRKMTMLSRPATRPENTARPLRSHCSRTSRRKPHGECRMPRTGVQHFSKSA